MMNVLYIGNYDRNGRLTDIRWRILLKWLSDNCNNIKIYAELDITQISNCFSKYCKVTEEAPPDPDLNYKGYRLWCRDKRLWDVIACSCFDIDTGITHIYFMNEEDCKAELEVEDCENFVVLHLSKGEENSMDMPLLRENVEECTYWKEQIDYLLDNEPWRPLGE